MKRHELREKSMIAIYQNLLVNTDIDELIRTEFEKEPEEIDPYFNAVIHTAVSHKDEYAGYIDQVLDGWTFERLGYIEKAILLLGCSEFAEKKVEAAVIIDECVELAKKYCDEDTYKLINRVLDII
ncbi:MAG: transcription antitermination factor NusB [Erysipelotrichaceae bacterium]|nr:transcription antitermination factor NusB [Erysipelotrichaceae bacterium]